MPSSIRVGEITFAPLFRIINIGILQIGAAGYVAIIQHCEPLASFFCHSIIMEIFGARRIQPNGGNLNRFACNVSKCADWQELINNLILAGGVTYTPMTFFNGHVHTFSIVDLPSSPAGLNNRIKIKIANAMPSR